MDLSEKKILVTGGSKGIGKSLVKEFVNRGARDIAIMARGAESLKATAEEFHHENIITIKGDIASTADLDKATEVLQKKWGKLDILVNNAGVVSAGLIEEVSDEDIINQVNINLTGVILMTKKVLPLLKKSSDGAIIQVSSGLGYIAQPFYSVYAATKAAVRQFSDAMRRELHAYPLHVMTIYPTTTDTPMMVNAKVSKTMDSPDEVARRSIEGLLNKELNVIFGGEQRLEGIETNFHHPEDIDRRSIENFEAYRERTANHRAM